MLLECFNPVFSTLTGAPGNGLGLAEEESLENASLAKELLPAPLARIPWERALGEPALG